MSEWVLECNISQDVAAELWDKVQVDEENNQCMVSITAWWQEFKMLAANIGATEIWFWSNACGTYTHYGNCSEWRMCLSDNCPLWYHVPSRAEWNEIRRALRNEWWTTATSSAESNFYKTNMILPGAWLLPNYNNTSAVDAIWNDYLYTSTVWENGDYIYVQVDPNGVFTPTAPDGWGISLRCFRNEDPIPAQCGTAANTCELWYIDTTKSTSDGGWTYWTCQWIHRWESASCYTCAEWYTWNWTKCEYNCLNENGKEWNADTQRCECPASVEWVTIGEVKDQCTVTIHVSDTKDVVMMAANVWATSIWTTTASVWKWFQWWNNEWIISPSDAWFKPNVGNRDWVNPQDDTLWWWEWDNPGWARWLPEVKDSWNLREERQWPCPHGFHIPSHGEWEELSNYRRAWHWLENEALMPRAWVIWYDGAEWTYRTVNNSDSWYWSSSRRWVWCAEWKCASYFNMPLNNSWSNLPAMERWTALQVRCIQNTDDPDRKVTFKIWDEEKEIVVEDYTRLSWYPTEFDKEWYDIVTDDYDFDNPTPIITDTVINLRYVAQKYVVTFDTVGWTQIDPIKVDYWVSIPLPANPKKECNEFSHWDNVPATMPANNITITALWNYTCNRYSGWGGRRVSSQTDTHWSADEQDIKWDSQDSESKTTSWQKEATAKILGWELDMEKYDSKYSFEQNQAYQFSYVNWITTKSVMRDVMMNKKLTRIEMAKMLSYYAMNVLQKEPDISKWTIKFKDVSLKMNEEYNNAVILAYQLWIMWQNMPNNKFRPKDEVTRAEFATALSRMLYHTLDGEYKSTPKYYAHHMERLLKEWIITKDEPKMKELRWYVMIMLMRTKKQ